MVDLDSERLREIERDKICVERDCEKLRELERKRARGRGSAAWIYPSFQPARRCRLAQSPWLAAIPSVPHQQIAGLPSEARATPRTPAELPRAPAHVCTHAEPDACLHLDALTKPCIPLFFSLSLASTLSLTTFPLRHLISPAHPGGWLAGQPHSQAPRLLLRHRVGGMAPLTQPLLGGKKAGPHRPTPARGPPSPPTRSETLRVFTEGTVNPRTKNPQIKIC